MTTANCFADPRDGSTCATHHRHVTNCANIFKDALEGVVQDIAERMAQEGFELGTRPRSHYSEAMNTALIALHGSEIKRKGEA